MTRCDDLVTAEARVKFIIVRRVKQLEESSMDQNSSIVVVQSGIVIQVILLKYVIEVLLTETGPYNLSALLEMYTNSGCAKRTRS